MKISVLIDKGYKKILKILIAIPNSFHFYFLLFPAFYSEKKAVYSGMQKFRSNLKKKKYAAYCLRRNLHRIEKGLTHINSKDSFGEKYILETINAFAIEKQRNKDNETLHWANSVLKIYFENVDYSKDPIKTSRKAFEKLIENDVTDSYSYSNAYLSGNGTNLNVEQVRAFFESRKSIRWFENKKVDSELLIEAAKLANSAPSACNRQPIKIHIYDDPETIQKISSLPPGAFTFNKNVPVFILFIGSLDAYFSERDRHTIYVDGGLLAMNFMLALEVYGLSSCPINWPDMKSLNRKLSKVIGLESYEKCVMCLAVGHAKKEQLIPLSIRKSVENLVVFNRFKD